MTDPTPTGGLPAEAHSDDAEPYVKAADPTPTDLSQYREDLAFELGVSWRVGHADWMVYADAILASPVVARMLAEARAEALAAEVRQKDAERPLTRRNSRGKMLP